MLSKQYFEAYTKIYATITKWSKRDKHRLPCWFLMLRMVCVGPLSFFQDRKREPLVPKLLEGAKKARLAASALRTRSAPRTAHRRWQRTSTCTSTGRPQYAPSSRMKPVANSS